MQFRQDRAALDQGRDAGVASIEAIVLPLCAFGKPSPTLETTTGTTAPQLTPVTTT